MELKHLTAKYIYRIEAKPDGGFIARATDPAIPALEAPTRAELQEKIQATVAAGLAADFPGLKLSLGTNELKFSFHVERKPDGGFTIHSSDPKAASIEAATHGEVESHFAEKLIASVGKHLAPELSQALAAQGASGDIKVFVRKTGFTLGSGAHNPALGNAPGLPPGGSMQAPGATTGPAAIDGAIIKNTNFGSAPGSIDSSPITPGGDRSGSILRFLLAALIVAALMYLFLHRR